MNPFTAPIDAQRQAWEYATQSLEAAQVAPDRTETMAEVEVGETPNEVVYEENKLRLLHYEPLTDEQHDVPILIVYALINRPYILDLQPGRSVVRRLLEAGFDVYLIDWGEPSTLDASLTLEDYVTRYIDNCVDEVRERSGVDAINVLGYCMGGTMSAMYAALFPEKVRNLGLMAAGLYFDETGGVLEEWGDERFYDPETIAETFGNVPAGFLDVGFALMDPVNNYVTKYANLYDNLEDEDFVENFARMERWLSDGVDVAGEAYREFLEDIYQENRLYENELQLGDRHVDLDNIEMPVLQIVGEYDHLIPPEASRPFNDAIPSDDTRILEAATGHIGLSVSGSSHEDLWPEVAEWFRERSDPDPDADVAADEQATLTTGANAGEGASTDATTAEDASTTTAEEDLTVISGIGSTYARRLRDAGVTTVRQLATADAAELADQTDVPEANLADWIAAAADRTD